MSLKQEIEVLVSKFVSDVMEAMSRSSLVELGEQEEGWRASTAPAPKRGRTAKPVIQKPAPKKSDGDKRYRTSAADIEKQKNLALKTALLLSGQFSKGEVMRASGSKVDLGRVLGLLVVDGKLKKIGDRRFTRYEVVA